MNEIEKPHTLTELDQFIAHARWTESVLREGGVPRKQWGMVARAAEKFRDSLPPQVDPSEKLRSSPQPGLLHIKGESGTLCGVKNPSHVTDGVRYADCSACLAAVTEQAEAENR